MSNTETKTIYRQLGISEDVWIYGQKIEEGLKERFAEFDSNAEYNQLKVISAMQQCRVNESCFNYASGYGYNDQGRDTLEEVYAAAFHTEAALVRPQITCGTHALALALSANLRPGDELLSPVGKPYDTLEEVIGIRQSKGSLAEYGVTYKQVDLLEDGYFDYPAIEKALNERTKLVTIQRSKGYQTRPSYSVEKIGELIAFIKKKRPDVICMVDNCYGEFVEECEPLELGADVIAGSLIKNPGGGLAPTGGYIAGRADLIERIGWKLTSPGIGLEVGSYAAGYLPFFQGLFLAPHVVGQALRGAVFAASVYSRLGYRVSPEPGEKRGCIIQSIGFNTPEELIAFCQDVQRLSPVESHVLPEPWDMPGYQDKVIMAAGAFIQGSSIEFSADAPIREPYIAYMQGGLVFEQVKAAVLKHISGLDNI